MYTLHRGNAAAKDAKRGEETTMTQERSLYFFGTGRLQKEYEEMCAAQDAGTFEFTQASQRFFHSYYRYYNDGDFPGWARSRWDISMVTYSTGAHAYECYRQRRLTAEGEEEFEQRLAERIAFEYRRFQHKHSA